MTFPSIANHCPNLETLKLDDCDEVTDVGVSAVVSSCKFLIKLELRYVWRLQGDFLPSISKCLPGLKVLDLGDCLDIEEQHILELLTERPGLHIKYRRQL